MNNGMFAKLLNVVNGNEQTAREYCKYVSDIFNLHNRADRCFSIGDGPELGKDYVTVETSPVTNSVRYSFSNSTRSQSLAISPQGLWGEGMPTDDMHLSPTRSVTAKEADEILEKWEKTAMHLALIEQGKLRHTVGLFLSKEATYRDLRRALGS
jgi:hypothetical protein